VDLEGSVQLTIVED